MFRKTPLASAVGAISVAGALMALGVSTPAFAQGDEIEEVVITGSRIKRADLESANPVTVVDSVDIEMSGLTDVGNFLQRMPSMSGSPIGTTTNNGGDGSVRIDLRGLGPIRTLTLVNGRRTVDAGDYQTIPAAMIERVEILKDGGSAVYGADAVAGVVNIITKQNFDGFEFEVINSDYFDMDSGTQNTFSFIAGKDTGDMNFMFGAEYVDQEEAYQADAPWDYFQNSYGIYPAGCESQVTSPYTGAPDGGCYPLGSSRIPEARLRSGELAQRFYTDGTPRLFDWFNGELNGPASDPNADFDPTFGVPTFNNPVFMNPGSGLTAYDGRTYNYSPVNYIQTPYKRTNIFAEADFDLSDNLRLSTEFRYNNRKSAQELAPMPYNSPTDPGYAGIYQPIDPLTGLPLREIDGVDVDGEDVTYYTADQNLGQVVSAIAYNGISPDNFYNPYSFPITDARRRMVETTRRFEQDADQFQLMFQLDGSFGDIDWDAFYNRGWQTISFADYGQFSGPRLANAMGPSADLDSDGTPECYSDINDPTTLIAGCVPVNFFGGPGAMTQDMIDYLSIDLNDTLDIEQLQWGVNFTGGFDVSEMKFGWAAGFEHQEIDSDFRADSSKQIDAVTGNTGAGTKGATASDAVYAEFLADLFDNGSQSVSATLGLRYDDFDAFGSNTTYQFGIEAYVMPELKFRATRGEVFRAPGIVELFAGVADGFPTATDPCASATPAPGCAQQSVQTDTQLLARVGGNTELDPEFGDTFTAGVVWTPDFDFGDLSLTVDYWNTELEDLIINTGVQYTLDECYRNNNAEACSRVFRRADYSIAYIEDIPINAASAEAEGIDTELRVDFDISMGEIQTSILWSHWLTNDFQSNPQDEVDDLKGRYAFGNAFAEDKISYDIIWVMDNFSVGYAGEYISELTTQNNLTFIDFLPADYEQNIDAQLYHDLVATYQLEDYGLRFGAGITNVTDEEPPYIDPGFNANTDPSTYRLFGRGYYFRMTWTPDL